MHTLPVACFTPPRATIQFRLAPFFHRPCLLARFLLVVPSRDHTTFCLPFCLERHFVVAYSNIYFFSLLILSAYSFTTYLTFTFPLLPSSRPALCFFAFLRHQPERPRSCAPLAVRRMPFYFPSLSCSHLFSCSALRFEFSPPPHWHGALNKILRSGLC